MTNAGTTLAVGAQSRSDGLQHRTLLTASTVFDTHDRIQADAIYTVSTLLARREELHALRDSVTVGMPIGWARTHWLDTHYPAWSAELAEIAQVLR